jgi:diphthine synthase
MALYFIGIGLYDEKDMSLKGVEVAKNCDVLFLELYTHEMNTSRKKLEKLIGRKIIELTRKQVEEESEIILEPSKTKKVGLLVGGDPFSATTHMALRHKAMEMGIKTKVIHGSSIFSAIGEVGLHMYKFGSTITIPYPERVGNKLPFSAYDRLKSNKEMGLHTLMLLDIDRKRKRVMTANEGMKIFLEMENQRRESVFSQHTDVIVFARANSEEALIVYGKVIELIDKDFGKPPMVIIVPGSLHFTEKDYLEMFKDER